MDYLYNINLPIISNTINMEISILLTIIGAVGAGIGVAFEKCRKSRCSHIELCNGCLTIDREVENTSE